MKNLEIVLATRNKDKIKEIKKILKSIPIKILTLSNFKRFPNVKEKGKTIEQNAIKKAKIISKFTNKITLADDTGLEVVYLNRKPGVYSSRFAGSGCSYDDNNQKLLNLLSGIHMIKRKAVFRTVMALAKPDGKVKYVEGKCFGRISEKKLGKNGFGYDPVFIPKGFRKTFAQMKPSTKNRISHRAKALVKSKKLLKCFLSGCSAVG
ncbi:MAG: RdgB/HAM1 family non-canonical purine NTP pyrophosphatase [Candidatus Firestonebacteria bacterium]